MGKQRRLDITKLCTGEQRATQRELLERSTENPLWVFSWEYLADHVWEDTPQSEALKHPEIYYRNWPMQSWRLKSPMMFSLQDEEPGKPEMWFIPSLKAGELRGQWCKSQSKSHGPRTRSTGWMSQLKQERKFTLLPQFLSVQALHRVDETHPHCWTSSLLSLPRQMIISFRNPLVDTPRNSVLSVIGASPSLIKLINNVY